MLVEVRLTLCGARNYLRDMTVCIPNHIPQCIGEVKIAQ